jgi:WD40 repeat protein
VFPSANCYNVDSGITRCVIGAYPGYLDGHSPVRWIEVPDGREWHEVEMGAVDRVCDVAFDRSGKLLAVTSATRVSRRVRERCKVEVFRLAPKKPPVLVASMPTARPAGLVIFNATGTRLAVAAGLGGVDDFEVFDVRTARRVLKFDPKVPDRRSMAFLADGRFVAAAGTKVYIVPATGGEPQFELGTGKALVNDVAASADGHRVIAALNNGTIEVWDTVTGAAGPRFAWGIGGVYSIALAPDGLTCAAAGSRGRVVIWDVDA